MPTEEYEVIVSVSEDVTDRDIVIANASQYLAYADQTDTFGYSGSIVDVDVRDSAVALKFLAIIENDGARERFLSEMEQLARVTESTQLSNYPA